MKKQVSVLIAILMVAVLVLSACGKKDEAAKDGAAAGGKSAPASTVKLGIFKNVTHAAGYVALEKGLFQKYWGDNVKIEVTPFDNGSDFSTALATGEIDLGFVGPGPSTNQFIKSKNFRVISGSNNGGAVLVAGKDSGISSPKDLVGKTVAIPTKGSTNEISLRLLLKQNNLNVTTDKSGVQIIARAPADTLVAMRQKEIDATLIPEPWGTQMEQEGIGKIIVDWDKIPPNNGNYPLTILVAGDKFLKEHRDMAKQAIQANADAIEYIKKNPDESYELINNRLKALSGKGMDIALIKAALSRLNLTTDVSKEAIEEMAKVSIDAGYIKDVKKEELDLSKFVDLSLLEEVKAGK
ncbi:ABC transporter substrate-binding protein [Paenibacillus doosanensis]|uniref:Taurine-binding periplasmic protein n=1 Tax=Paenibacillus konkukensis TaxID=2020716 RepID=A0ABY4S0P4_9BACL|nr:MULTISPECIES: ABC transporter substrate-binding protein [Paenibacillus]MCS7459385.1 ABC transporter substrate-binding protein [Paenibacillus doosanensis]UQZ87178.1 Taurine-binding periplasmic protein precursor [Paenibacillus konkukensis]